MKKRVALLLNKPCLNYGMKNKSEVGCAKKAVLPEDCKRVRVILFSEWAE